MLADPRDADPELREHRESCPECREYTERLLRFELTPRARAARATLPTEADGPPAAAASPSYAAAGWPWPPAC